MRRFQAEDWDATGSGVELRCKRRNTAPGSQPPSGSRKTAAPPSPPPLNQTQASMLPTEENTMNLLEQYMNRYSVIEGECTTYNHFSPWFISFILLFFSPKNPQDLSQLNLVKQTQTIAISPVGELAREEQNSKPPGERDTILKSFTIHSRKQSTVRFMFRQNRLKYHLKKVKNITQLFSKY